MGRTGHYLLLAASLCCMGCDSDGRSDGVSVDEPAMQKLLAHYDEQFDPDEQMLQVEFSSPGYHTRFQTGDLLHPTRESLVYALALLKRGASKDTARAAKILRRVLPLQDSNQASATFGTWPWLLEEPLEEMTSPDLNWADFCGASLVHILVQHSGQLPDDLRRLVETGLRNATTAIQKRDVGPGYTNIAVLGGGVCAAAGEQFGEDSLLIYGRARLQGVVEHTEKHGGFNEYNSPPYCKVVIAECERILELVEDKASRDAAESIRQSAWKMISESFHQPTQQWAGPHSRNSKDRLRVTMVDFLARRTGVALETHPTMRDGNPRGYGIVQPQMCPEVLLTEFRAGKEYPYQIQRVFVNAKTKKYRRVGTTWFDELACLGSVNRSSCWTQRKPLLAYWKTDADPAVVFRLRFLHDGRDFASMGVRTAQDHSRALSTFFPIQNSGSWHPSLDRPEAGIFRAKDLRVRCELRGEDVTAKSLGEGRFELAAGKRRVILHTATGRFAERDVSWKIGRDKDRVFLDGVCYTGPDRNFDFRDLTAGIFVGLELLAVGSPMATEPPQASPTSQSPSWQSLSWQWGSAKGERIAIQSEAQ
jgi:hypothetical protein